MANKEYGFTDTEQEQVAGPVDTIDVQQQKTDLHSLQEEIGGELADFQTEITTKPVEHSQENQEYAWGVEREKQQPHDPDWKFGMNFLDPTLFPPRNIEQWVVS